MITMGEGEGELVKMGKFPKGYVVRTGRGVRVGVDKNTGFVLIEDVGVDKSAGSNVGLGVTITTVT